MSTLLEEWKTNNAELVNFLTEEGYKGEEKVQIFDNSVFTYFTKETDVSIDLGETIKEEKLISISPSYERPKDILKKYGIDIVNNNNIIYYHIKRFHVINLRSTIRINIKENPTQILISHLKDFLSQYNYLENSVQLKIESMLRSTETIDTEIDLNDLKKIKNKIKHHEKIINDIILVLNYGIPNLKTKLLKEIEDARFKHSEYKTSLKLIQFLYGALTQFDSLQ